MARALTLGAGVADAIRSHGRDTYPHECCGALLGGAASVKAVVALPNKEGSFKFAVLGDFGTGDPVLDVIRTSAAAWAR